LADANGKSFLVLFFKKEQLSSFGINPRQHPDGPTIRTPIHTARPGCLLCRVESA